MWLADLRLLLDLLLPQHLWIIHDLVVVEDVVGVYCYSSVLFSFRRQPQNNAVWIYSPLYHLYVWHCWIHPKEENVAHSVSRF